MERPPRLSRSEEELEPEAEFGEVPLEYWFNVALKLPYFELPQFCRQKKELAQICRDPVFWQRKIKHDFPERPFYSFLHPTLEEEQYRARYQQLLADEIEEQKNELVNAKYADSRIRNLSDQINDKNREVIDLRRKKRIAAPNQKKELNEEIEFLRQQNQKLKDQIAELRVQYEREIEILGKRIEQLRTLAAEVLPCPAAIEYRIITVTEKQVLRLPPAEEDETRTDNLDWPVHYQEVARLVQLYENISYDAEKLWQTFINLGWVRPGKYKQPEIFDGLLIGLQIEPVTSSVPFDLIYVYCYQGQAHFQASGLYRFDPDHLDIDVLPNQLVENYSLEEIREVYQLPFKIRSDQEAEQDEFEEEEQVESEEGE
jgi:hypothetical protein